SSLCCSSHDHEVTSTGFTVIKLLRLGAERFQPFRHIRARARTRPALERKPLGERVALSFVYEPLVGPNGVPGVRNDRSSKLVRYRFEFSVRNTTVREAEGGRLRAADRSAGKHHLLGPQWTNPPPKALAHAPRRRHGPAPVCVGESRRLRRDEKVARKHQLKGAGVAVALHRRDYWLGQRFDRVQRLG